MKTSGLEDTSNWSKYFMCSEMEYVNEGITFNYEPIIRNEHMPAYFEVWFPTDFR